MKNVGLFLLVIVGGAIATEIVDRATGVDAALLGVPHIYRAIHHIAYELNGALIYLVLRLISIK